DRHVEVLADQHALAGQVEVGHSEDGHGLPLSWLQPGEPAKGRYCPRARVGGQTAALAWQGCSCRAPPQLVRLTPTINTICCARRCRPRGRLKREAGADHGPIPALPRSGNGNEPVMALGRTSREAAAV